MGDSMNILKKIRRAVWPQFPSTIESGSWKIADCSLAGTGHLRRGRGCEDAGGWFRDGSLLCIAVADGAGSAPQAALGSSIAVHTALLALREHHMNVSPISAQNAKSALVAACRQTVSTLCITADGLGADRCHLACTLILLVASPNFVFAAQIGDGAVVVKDANGNLISLTTPINGEFANEAPLIGCAPSMDVQVRSLPRKPGDTFRLKSIAAFSDGIMRLALKLPQGEPHPPFFTPLFDRLECLAEPDMKKMIQNFLNSPRVNARTDDDKTLITAVLQ
jgi:hypothetical protein